MKNAVEMDSGGMICMPSFIIPLDIQKLTGGNTQTHRENGDPIGLLSFFRNVKIRLDSWKI
jgi:hypothetical protein